MFDKLEKLLMPIAEKLGNNKVLAAIRDGFLITTPLLIVGSVFLLIANFPIPGWSEFWTRVLGEGWENWFKSVSSATFDMIGLLTAIGTGYAYSRELDADKIQGAVVSFVTFIILTPTKIKFEGVNGQETLSALDFKYIGSDGIFLGLVAALLSVYIFNWVYKKGWTIKMPAGVPPAVADSFAALIPSAVVMGVFFLIRIVFEFTQYETFHNFVYQVLQAPLKGAGNTLLAQIIYKLAVSIFWFFGINGPAVANTVFTPIFKVLTIENLNAFEAGLPLPNIFTDPFSSFFTVFGGGGSTLSLVIIMVLLCKSERIKKLGKLALIPGIFGINEPIIFGLPIVLNPVLIIPFIGVPIVNLLLSTWATKAGILAYTTGVSLPWSTPIGFSGYLTTGSVFAGVWQFILLIIGCLIYYPFIIMLDKKYLIDEKEAEKNKSDVDDISFDDLSFDDLSFDDL